METTVENPDLVDKFTADDKGRITLGVEFANEDVQVAVQTIDNKEGDNNE